jgi:hypothetical protein
MAKNSGEEPPVPSRRAAAGRRTPKEGAKNRGVWLLVALLLVVIGGLLVAWFGLLDSRFAERGEIPGLQTPATREVSLYFSDPRWTRLVTETRRFKVGGDATEMIGALVEALAEGPRGDGAPVLPKGARLRGAYLGREGLAVIDFEPELEAFSPGGAAGELLTVFALVHTISENVPGIRSVQILVGGRERETLAGHVKISEPLGRHPQLETRTPQPQTGD